MIRQYITGARKYNLGVRHGTWLALQDMALRFRSWWKYKGPLAGRRSA